MALTRTLLLRICRCAAGLAVASAVLLSIGCETSVNPIIGEDRPYTMWGFFDAGADTQKVRVFSIEEFPGIDRPGAVDASVTSTDLTTGEMRQWTYRRVTYADSATGHVFFSPFRTKHEHRYRLEVARSDGETASATVTVPPEMEVVIEQDPFNPSATAYIYGDVPNLISVAVRYEATNLPPLNSWPENRPVHPTVFFPVDVPYDGKGEQIPGGWRFYIDLAKDFELVQDAFKGACLVTGGAPDIALRRVEFRLFSADSSWRPPNGVFDPDVLVEPGTMSNVKNGYGFFGAGRMFNERWLPPAHVRRRIGYRYDRPCSLQPAPVPSCMEPPVPCFEDEPDDAYRAFF